MTLSAILIGAACIALGLLALLGLAITFTMDKLIVPVARDMADAAADEVDAFKRRRDDRRQSRD